MNLVFSHGKECIMGKDLKGKQLGTGLSQRKDGRYQARLTTNNGKRIEKNFTKLADAKEWLMSQKYTKHILTTNDLTVDQWYNFWMSNYKIDIVRDNTADQYRSRYQFNIKDAIGKMKLADVKPIHCQRLLNQMFDCGKYSHGTINLVKVTMHDMFKYAVENEYILKNPADNLKMKPVAKAERRVLSREEQKTFKQYAENTLYSNAYCLVLETGLRVGEVGGLQWGDIDFEQRTMMVKRTLLQDSAKGGFYFGSPKTKNSIRTIPLTMEAVKILESQQALQQKLRAKSTNWSTEWDTLVFTTRNGNPVSASTLRMMMVRIVKNINFDRKYNHEAEFPHCYMHALRHTFATRCIEQGIQPKTLQKILGHSNINTTMDLYVHVTHDQLLTEIQKMDSIVL